VRGTLRYMAPEHHAGKVLTPAADQYAFCVALWEGLCGTPPFSGLRAISDKGRGPPPWSNPAVPQPIVQAVIRGLAPRPDERWPSMGALLDALSRRGPRRRRQRWGLAGVAGLVLGIGALRVATNAQARRCTGAAEQLEGIWDEDHRAQVRAAIVGVGRDYATRVWERTQRELDEYAEAWTQMHTAACEASTVRGEQSTEVMDLRMGCLHRAAVDLRATVDTLAEADAAVVQEAHELIAALRPLARCADLEALAADVEPPLPEEADAVEEIRARLAKAKVLRGAGKYEEAAGVLEAAAARVQAVQYGPVHTELALERGLVLDRRGDYEGARVALSEALELASQWRQWSIQGEAATKLVYVLGYRQLQPEVAVQHLMVAKGRAQGDPLREAGVATAIATVSFAQGRYAEAVAEYRVAKATLDEVLDPDHPKLLALRNDLGTALSADGQRAEAEAELRAAGARLEQVLGPEHPDVASLRTNLAILLAENDEEAEAEAELWAALKIYERALGPEHPQVASTRSNLALALDSQGKYEQAEAQYRGALTQFETSLDPDHPLLAMARTNLGVFLVERDRAREALPLLEQAWVRRQRADTPSTARIATAFTLAGVLWAVHETSPERSRAVELAEDALRTCRAAEDANQEFGDEIERWLATHPRP
ncbi:MAG: tetratricopeptide repeat-containing protein kinase family protein, partial [Nannocystaceae bacterium]